MSDDMSMDSDFRRLAEERVQAKNLGPPAPKTEEQARRLVHELEVHQVELEMQNEELRQTRHALETSLKKYTDLYDFAPVGYLTLDRDGSIKEANLAIAILLDTARSKLLGRRFGLFVAPEARATFKAFLEKAFASHTTKSWEGPLLSVREPPLLVRIEALTVNSGQEIRTAIIDLSILRQMQQELTQAHATQLNTSNTQLNTSNTQLNTSNAQLNTSNAQLNTSNAQLDTSNAQLDTSNAQLEAFAYTVSHELQTPLVTILNFVGQLQQDLERNDQVNIPIDFDFISKAALEMRTKLDDLLKLSRSGRAISDPLQIDLSSLVERSVPILGSQLAHVNLQIDIPANHPVVYGDPVRLHHVFQNLLGNAAKFTRESHEPRIEVGCTTGDGFLTCFVRDNGIGISSKYHDRVFKIFEQLSPSEEGTGIGLAIVRRIVEEHGGKVWVESAGEGQGSTFFFTLPTGSPSSSTDTDEEKG